MTEQFPLRQQHKAATRQKLILAAQELFQNKGYEATTLEGIAARAGLHVQTLYRHFNNKIELAAAGDEEQLTHFRNAIRNEQRQDTTIQFWRSYVESMTTLVTAGDGGRNYRQLLHHELESPVVSLSLIRLSQEYKDLLAESLERDLNLDDPRERRDTARLIAITLWGAHEYVMVQYDRQEDLDLVYEIVAIIDRIEQLYGNLFQDPPQNPASR